MYRQTFPQKPVILPFVGMALFAVSPLALGQDSPANVQSLKPIPNLQFKKINTDGQSPTTITLPAGHQAVFYPIGTWNPDGGGTLLSKESSLGARGIDTLRWTGYGSDVYRLFKLGDSVPGGEFTSPKHNFFCLLWKNDLKDEWRPVAEVWDHISNNEKEDRVITFQVNDQKGQFYNNTSDLHLIYHISPGTGLPWGVDYESFDLDTHRRKLENAKSVLVLPSASGTGNDVDLRCYWYLIRYFDKSGEYSYGIPFWNDGKKTFDGKIKITDNEGNSITRSLVVPAGGSESKMVNMVGMTINTITPLEYKTREPAKPKSP
jgi:hypothetical protein